MKKKRKLPARPKKKRPAVKRARRDTPVDAPPTGEPASFDPQAVAEQALSRVRRVETIEAAYQAWSELRREHAGALSKLASERRQLEQQGEFLVGAVRAARDLGQSPTVEQALALARTNQGDGLDSFVLQTAARLEGAKSQLEQRTRAAQGAFGEAFAAIRTELLGRVARTLKHVKPRLKLMIRPIGPERRILHLVRPQADEAVLLAWVLLGKLPSRYDFLFDDSTDDLSLPPPMLYPEEGVTPALTRPTAPQVEALVRSELQVLPIKGVVPFLLPRGAQPAQLGRLVERGPVMEVELADGQQFRNLLTREEAERVAGYFLRLKLEQQLEIELVDS